MINIKDYILSDILTIMKEIREVKYIGYESDFINLHNIAVNYYDKIKNYEKKSAKNTNRINTLRSEISRELDEYFLKLNKKTIIDYDTDFGIIEDIYNEDTIKR